MSSYPLLVLVFIKFSDECMQPISGCGMAKVLESENPEFRKVTWFGE